MKWHACVVLPQIAFRFLFETASHGFVRPCDRAESGRPGSNCVGVARPSIPLGHCGGSFVLPRVPDRAGTIVAPPLPSASRSARQTKQLINARAKAARPNLA